MSFLKDNFSRLSIYFSVMLAAVSIVAAGYWNKEKRVIENDIISYYAYLPATIIFNDIKLEKDQTYKHGIFWPETTPEGAKVIKTTMGLSFLYSPFFLAAHAVAKIAGLEAYGFSPIYKIGLLISALFYFYVGLWFLRKILKMWFPENVVAVVLLSVVLGTNLFYYSVHEATMSHVYNFALFNIFIWLTVKWHKSPKVGTLILTGALAGLITLARPSNIIILLFFFFYGIYSKETFIEKVKLLFSKFHWFVFMGIAFTAIWIPQFLYWKINTGSLLFYSYTSERFFFNDPHFLDGLLSYRKGWFIYTPIMVFALIGIFFTFKKLKEVSIAITVFSIVNMYIIFSWWCWWYGGSFGMRPMIDSYGMLAIPMAALFSSLRNYRKNIYRVVVGICLIFIVQNFFFIRKYRRGSIHWDSMTKEAFWHSFCRTSPLPGYWDLLEKPDYEKAKQGKDAVVEE